MTFVKATSVLHGLTCLLSLPAPAAEVKDTRALCVVMAFGKEPNDVKRYFAANVMLKESRKPNDDNTVEIFRSEHAIYQAYISQHRTWNDGLPQLSNLMLTIRDRKTGKLITSAAAAWPRVPADGRLEGLTRLELRSEMAEPEYEEVVFHCDARLLD